LVLEVSCYALEKGLDSLIATEKAAQDMFKAVTDNSSGVLPWLITQW
jgi:hypothetical protein